MKIQIPKIIILLVFVMLTATAAPSSELHIDTTSPFVYPQYSKKISMDFQEAPLVDVLKIFSQQSSLNLVTSESIANKSVTVYLDNVPVEQALEQILRANNLTYELQPESDIYLVKPITKPSIELLTRVYNLRHASVTGSKVKKIIKIKLEGGGQTEDESDEDIGILGAVKRILTNNGNVTEDPRTNSLIITDIASNFPNIERTIARLDVPIPQILIEVEMLEVSKETVDRMGIKIGETPLIFSGGTRTVYYPWNQNDLIRQGIISQPGYSAGLVSATGLSAVLQFLRTQKGTKNLARPRILTLNNEVAQIKISTNEAIGIKQQTTSAGGATGSTTKEAERVETGVFLTVTPQANTSTNEITLAIIPKVIIARTGATFDNQTFRDPEERGSQSILKVQSGETIIIGGLLRTDRTNVVTKVPVLGDIPLIGSAFRHKDDTLVERELIIFITPHIIKEKSVPRTASMETKQFVREQDLPFRQINEAQKELAN